MKKTLLLEGACPFYCKSDSLCLASISMMTVSDLTALVRCGGEDHDECPFFISKVLRKI
ncbi:MAG: hypothetical protein M0Z61_14170 [Nitrospiraceae bacterium]|nr:hypothetical protein [Nitrospiraceae bacterium]